MNKRPPVIAEHRKATPTNVGTIFCPSARRVVHSPVAPGPVWATLYCDESMIELNEKNGTRVASKAAAKRL